MKQILRSPKHVSIVLILFSQALCSFVAGKHCADNPKVLVFSKTAGYHHNSIAVGVLAIQKLGNENGYGVDTTSYSTKFTEDNLKHYSAVIFLNTTGNVLNGEQQMAFERYIQAGGGYVGVHAAADTEYEWAWYGKLVGAYFESHPREQTATVDVTDKNHSATADLPEHWQRMDEWYNYKAVYADLKILANLDEATYEGGTMSANHPITWYHEFDGGRAFYTGLGHRNENYSDPAYLKHLQGGIKYAMGDGVKLDYGKAYSTVTPEQNRFAKTVLAANIPSPMELAVADDGRVFFVQLFGEFSVFNTKTNTLKQIYKFPISNVGGTGLMGITLDPKFTTNNFLYLYYAPGGQTGNPLYWHLSRFTMKGDDIDLASEKLLLKVEVQKISGSHHGGSLAWDGKGNLFLSTGDAISPFPSDGYAPLDERYNVESNGDAQGTAGNTNDLRGKVLRIHPEADGTYTIPEGNLFPRGTAKTRPEIYVMGLRNPFRITVNKRSGVLYWGEVGPDAGNDSPRGPRGYDEFNQAKKPGNFGWPYFIGNNIPYSKWDFVTGKPGPLFDPKSPVNNSPFNTGLTNLPPINSAMLWYPYAASPEFPELGLGGRTAIGGDIYYYNKNNTNPARFPDYYDGDLFIAEWMRNWVMSVRFDKNENYKRTEPFMAANGDFRRPIDMAFGSDGILYMLEYGSVYGLANKDSRLVKITYNRGNRAPIAKASVVDTVFTSQIRKQVVGQSLTISGQAPLRVSFSAKASADLDDDDAVTCQWLFDGKTPGPKTIDADYTYQIPGLYKAILKVTDKAGLVGRDTVLVKVGNTVPSVVITGPDNKSFYWKDKPFTYTIKVSDKEDGQIDTTRIKAYYVYNSLPANITEADLSKPSFGEIIYPGKELITGSDCKACHQTDAVAVGPSFMAIANKYKIDEVSVVMLSKKIISGGGGNWGKDFVMSAHPQITPANSREIVKYIFSLKEEKKSVIVNIPLKGSLKLHYDDNEPRGEYTIVAAYTDKGGKIVGSLKSTDIVTLRHAEMNSAHVDEFGGLRRFGDNITGGGDNSYLLLKNVDLTGITKLIVKYDAGKDAELRVRIDAKGGQIVGRVDYKRTSDLPDRKGVVTVPITKPVKGRHDVYVYAIKRTAPTDNIIHISEIEFK
jgi:cytochrome c